MAYTTIDKPTDYFNTVLFTGDGSDNRSITVGFQPDWVWCRQRTDASGGYIVDSVRGNNAALQTTNNNAEGTFASMTFESNGITVSGNENLNNENAHNYVVWNWLAGGTASSNTDGSITSSVSANTTAGFSIGTYTGNGSAGATVGHGLGATPKCFIVKRRNTAAQWNVYHESLGNTGAMYLNDNGTFNTVSGFWNNTSPNSTTFTLGTDAAGNGSSDTYVFYAFAEKKGYSKFGSYTGNGGGSSGTDGTYVHLGFKPAWVMTKCTSNTGHGWHMQDNKRDGFNYKNYRLFANSTGAEETTVRMDLLSNGFKYRDNDGNGNGFSYIYMAFAENPFVSSGGIPCTAR